MAARTRGGSRGPRALTTFAALIAGGMIFGGVAIAVGAPAVLVLLVVIVLAAALALAVTW